jgi:uncharacterized protein YdaU (DUF1376 family)
LAQGRTTDDDRQPSKITKLPLKTWCEYRPTLQDFFYEGWKHKRIDVELTKMLRVSQKRAIAGQKGGIGSALARMKLENSSRSARLPPRAIAAPSSGARANADHSHSHQSLLQARPAPAGPERQQTEKPAISVSPELAAYVAGRTT